MNRMECSISDGPNYEESTPEREEPEFIRTDIKQIGLLPERIQITLDDFREDNADIDVMAYLLEECLTEFAKMADSHTELCSKVDDTADKLRESLMCKPQGE